MGHRERSKLKRRRHILLSALRLFAEQGYSRTTIGDIAEASEVAPRTVSGYFPSKLDFVTEWPSSRSRRLIELYQQHPGIAFVAFIDLYWHDARENLDREEAALTRAMALANPGIAAMAEVAVAHRRAPDAPHLPQRADAGGDLLQQAGGAAVRAVDQVFFAGIADGRMTDEAQAALLGLVASIAAETGTGHGALQPALSSPAAS
ncbi:TetR/AcrR family transcriptional regulator [Microbacterium enclense]|uniref:TetR/AcrR family transcriptional regulator n=1 Tax=Microbacterium enclense TaxID=993073 RepID=A0A3S3P1U1_9MICO|nr:TetR/AcrR family transcriptional regulator [Microbacterium enclense]